MGLYRPRELFDFLDAIGSKPRRALSQNFLIDQNIIDKLIQLAELSPGDTVLEIGPGPGAITEKLLATGAHVIAVEKDRKFAAELPRLPGHLTLIEGDFLKLDLKPLYASGPIKVVANLPFSITAPILTRLVPLYPHISQICVIVQKEVAERMTAPVRTKAYSALSVFMQFYSEARLAFKISPGSFTPRPRVDCAVADIHPRKPPLSDEEAFFRLVRTAFNFRRKQLQRSLRELYPPERVRFALQALQFSPQARPEELTASDFASLLDALA